MKFNTHYITLNKKQKRIHTIIRAVLLSLCIFGFALFVRELIFPTYTFNYDATIDSLANTISRPYVTEHGTGFHLFVYGQSNKAQVSITLPKNTPELPSGTEVLIKKSYIPFLSSESTEKYTDHIVSTLNNNDQYYIEQDDTLHSLISSNAFDSYLFTKNVQDVTAEMIREANASKDYIGFAPATLISSREGVFVTDGDTKHPVQDERTFLALGYDFDNVISTNNEERSLHKNAKMLTVKSTHPSGTIFYAEDTKKTFIFDNELLNKIQTSQTAKKHAITTQEASRHVFESCKLRKTAIPRKYTCTTSLDNISNFDGNAFQFTLKNAPNTEVAGMHIRLFTTISENSLEDRIHSIKRKIETNYN